MNCAEFERDLAALLDESLPKRDRGPAAERLEEHARSCPACRGAADLASWASLAPSERFVDEEPDEAYWTSFDRALAARVAAERPARSRHLRPWLAAAAAVVLAVTAGIFWMRQGPDPAVAEIDPGIVPEAAFAMDWTVPDDRGFPPDLELSGPWSDASPGGPLGASWDEIDWYDGSELAIRGEVNGAGAMGMRGLLLPPEAIAREIRGLDDEGRSELLRWLREQTGEDEGGKA